MVIRRENLEVTKLDSRNGGKELMQKGEGLHRVIIRLSPRSVDERGVGGIVTVVVDRHCEQAIDVNNELENG